MKPTLLVLAAGMGSRYGGVKQIDGVGLHDECLLDFATYDAMKCGFGKVVFIIRKDIEQAFRERLFDRIARNCDAEYVFQSRESLLTPQQIKDSAERTKPWGTTHAVLCAEKAINTPFAVINSDDYYGRQAFDVLGKYLSSVSNDCTEHAMVCYVLVFYRSRITKAIYNLGIFVSILPLYGSAGATFRLYQQIGFINNPIALITSIGLFGGYFFYMYSFYSYSSLT